MIIINAILQRVIMFTGGVVIALLGLVSPVESMKFILCWIDRLEESRQRKLAQGGNQPF
jgi:hypothetical protein